ncbi:MAG: hypothetical protein ABGZ35_25275 [Planctomycetaceae bacterium]
MNHLPASQAPPNFARKVLIGTSLGHSVVALLVLLLWILPSFQTGSGSVGTSGVGTGTAETGPGSGAGASGSGFADSGDQSSGRRKGERSIPGSPASSSSQTEGSTTAEVELATESDIETNQSSPPTRELDKADPNAFGIASLDPPPSAADTMDGDEDGFEGDSGSGSEVEKVFMGVKVKGSIALVCDISGSMHSDFPVLYRELRRKFPRNTPLILVVGCNFAPPNPTSPTPQKGPFPDTYGLGPRFAKDRYVYTSQNTTDAIIFSVERLKRRTVMFNNDLQDGGSEQAIDAFMELRRKRRFTLSGRSLNCNAPDCLRRFIKRSGGDFKVDPISRTRSSAVNWTP